MGLIVRKLYPDSEQTPGHDLRCVSGKSDDADSRSAALASVEETRRKRIQNQRNGAVGPKWRVLRPSG